MCFFISQNKHWQWSLANNISNFLQNTQNRHIISHHWLWDIRCLLWVQSMLFILLHSRINQNGHQFPDYIFKCIFVKENIWILLKISLKLVPKVWINNIPALFQIMAWHRTGNKLLSQSMMINLLTHICINWPQWVNYVMCGYCWLTLTNLHVVWYFNHTSEQQTTSDGVLIVYLHWRKPNNAWIESNVLPNF